MPKLLQINECLNFSTGKIAQSIGEKAMTHGWESWIAYSGREKELPCKSYVIKIGTFADACLHYATQRLFDNEGLSSTRNTRDLVKKIEEIKPDIIQLHNIHDHWLNYPILFDYLASLDTPVVWVQHDCWSFTGGCMYFDMLKCDRWKDGCKGCLDKRTILKNQAERNFKLKKEYLSKIKSLTFVPVSDWLADLLRESCQGHRPIVTIHNGTDLNVFKPIIMDSKKKRVDGKFRILGVAAVWDARKGLDDFIMLRDLLSVEYEILLVGLTNKQIKSLPEGIRGVSRTSDVHELAKLYAEADVFVNPTYSDNFPTTNIEALGCGTPVITYNTGGSPEAIDANTGAVVGQGQVSELCSKIKEFRNSDFKQNHTEDCRNRAIQKFDKDMCFEKYITLYNGILGGG